MDEGCNGDWREWTSLYNLRRCKQMAFRRYGDAGESLTGHSEQRLFHSLENHRHKAFHRCGFSCELEETSRAGKRGCKHRSELRSTSSALLPSKCSAHQLSASPLAVPHSVISERTRLQAFLSVLSGFEVEMVAWNCVLVLSEATKRWPKFSGSVASWAARRYLQTLEQAVASYCSLKTG